MTRPVVSRVPPERADAWVAGRWKPASKRGPFRSFLAGFARGALAGVVIGIGLVSLLWLVMVEIGNGAR